MSSNKKILMLLQENPYQPGGGLGVHVYNLCENLKSECEITTIGFDNVSGKGGFYKNGIQIPYQEWRPEKDIWRLLNIFPINNMNFADPLFDNYIVHNSYIHNLVNFLKEEKFDLVHIHDAPLYRIARYASMFYEIPIVLTVHLSFYFSHRYISKVKNLWKYASQTEATALKEVDGLITVSESYKKKINKYLYIPLEDIKVIPNGVEADFLSNIIYDEKLKEALIKGKEKMIVFVGRPVYTKGIELIIRTARKLKEYQFILIAHAPNRESGEEVKYIKRAERENNNITWLKDITQEEKWKIMKIADFGIMPSLHEPFGIVALEWMGLEVPLITTGIDGLREFCNPMNSDIIKPGKESLIKALRNNEDKREQIENGLETAREYNWQKVAKRTKLFYEKVMKEYADINKVR